LPIHLFTNTEVTFLNFSKRILVAPLNWGLGHATRCIPIIQELQKQGAEVILASDGRALELLKKEFPNLPIFELPPYNIRYPFSSMIFSVGLQFPKIIKAIWKENRAIQHLVEKEKIDVIISDNRFGCFSKKAKTVFLTHQLTIKMPFSWLEKPVRLGNFFWIRKFDELWIPDFAGEENLSGELSHLPTPKGELKHDKGTNSLLEVGGKKIKYIGALSRMKKYDATKKYDAIFILSGPEPQRTFLEKKILEQIELLKGKFLIVQGKTERKETFQLKPNIKIISFLIANELTQAILESELIVSRSGYSTLMDLFFLQKKALLIPTPGQTEQEYLAERFQKKNIFYHQKQDELNLEKAFQEIKNYTGFATDSSEKDLLKKAITELLDS